MKLVLGKELVVVNVIVAIIIKLCDDYMKYVSHFSSVLELRFPTCYVIWSALCFNIILILFYNLKLKILYSALSAYVQWMLMLHTWVASSNFIFRGSWALRGLSSYVFYVFSHFLQAYTRIIPQIMTWLLPYPIHFVIHWSFYNLVLLSIHLS